MASFFGPSVGGYPPFFLCRTGGQSTAPGMGCRKGSRATLESTPDSLLPRVHAGPDHPPTITVPVLPAASVSCRQRGCCFRWGQVLCPVCQALKVTWSEYRKSPWPPPAPEAPGTQGWGLPADAFLPFTAPHPAHMRPSDHPVPGVGGLTWWRRESELLGPERPILWGRGGSGFGISRRSSLGPGTPVLRRISEVLGWGDSTSFPCPCRKGQRASALSAAQPAGKGCV